ncbi:MAG TPA: toll/interleukin-1 receptor domain-containing protein [Caulobacteraceae bacterium]|nr:toll/interleukin-1 receptor domain-containing protein [Caulobacteraceae bacterium]
MSGVFLSYSRADRVLAGQIVRGLRALGAEVWWDEDMRGVDWQDELERQIGALDAVMVLWTAHSVGSMHVKDEARLGRDNGKLVNVMAGVPKPPFPFDSINGLPLDGWTGRAPHAGWTRAVETIEELVVRSGGVEKGAFTAALARRDAEVRRKEAGVERARDAFQEAQGRAAEAADAAARENAELAHAEEVYRRVVDLGAGSAVLRSAQDDLDKARAAKAEADAAERAANGRLSAASRGLSRATADLEKLFSDTLDPPAPPPESEQAMPAPSPAAEADPAPAPPPHTAAASPVSEPVAAAKPEPARAAAPAAAAAKRSIPVWVQVAGAVVALGGVAALVLKSTSPAPVPPSGPASDAASTAASAAVSVSASPASAGAAAPSAAAAAISAGDDAARAGDSKTAFADYLKAANLGDAKAQDVLCRSYYQGPSFVPSLGVSVNFNNAAHWCRLSAAQGYADAEGMMGVFYEEGVGVGEPRNFTKALYWYRLAAAQGDKFSQGELDNMYRNGQGVPKGTPPPY